jgi:hypothetical protein
LGRQFEDSFVAGVLNYNYGYRVWVDQEEVNMDRNSLRTA